MTNKDTIKAALQYFKDIIKNPDKVMKLPHKRYIFPPNFEECTCTSADDVLTIIGGRCRKCRKEDKND